MNVFCYVARMPDLLVQLDAGATVRGVVVDDGTSNGLDVYGIYDFIHVVCKKSGKYASRLWNVRLKKSFEDERLVWHVPLRINSVKTHKGPALTRVSLHSLLLMLGKRVKLDNNALTRFMSGDNSMVIKFDLDQHTARVGE
jgi:hypothetical protein